VALSVAVAPPAAAREPGASAQALGLGDAVRASAIGPSALFFNPAGMARAMMYSIEIGYDYDNPVEGHAFHSSVVDSKMNEYIAAGLGYSYLFAEKGDFGKEGHTIRFALASGYRSPTLSAFIGAGLRWSQFNRKYPTPDFEAVSADVGAVFDLFQMVQLGVVGHNLVKVDDQSEMPISLGLGIAFNYQGLLLSFDTILDFGTRSDTTPIYAVGAEYFVMGLIAVRLGFEADDVVDRKSVTFGVGYVSQFWGLDISSKISIEDESDAMVLTNFRIFLP
jgi:hypothetical protein